MADLETPIFCPPESYTHAHDRMLAEIYHALMDVRNRLEVLEMAAVQQSRLSRRVEALEQWHDESVTDGK